MKDQMYYLRVTCSNKIEEDKECGEELLTSVSMTKKQIQDSWVQMVMSKGFNTPKCTKCSYSTFSDLNIGTNMNICEIGSIDPLNKEEFLR